jgi:hypothetical protein
VESGQAEAGIEICPHIKNAEYRADFCTKAEKRWQNPVN